MTRPLHGLEQEVIQYLGDPQFLYAICWERESASSDPHPYRRALGFDHRSNTYGAEPHTKGSDGIDRIEGWRRAERLKARFFEEVARAIRDRTYRPAPFRRARLEKKDENGNGTGKYRWLAIPTYIDRVVIEGLRQLLEARLDPGIPRGFRGYRASNLAGQPIHDGKLVGHARGSTNSIGLSIRAGASSGFAWIAEMDVVGAFDNVSRRRLRRLLVDQGATMWLSNFIVRCTGTEVIDKQMNRCQQEGIAQGSPVSPLLWNLYATFLYLDSESVLTHGYADNIWYQTRTERDLELVRERIDRKLSEGNLEGKWSKSVDLRKESLVVLKEWEITPRGTRWTMSKVADLDEEGTRAGAEELSPCRGKSDSVDDVEPSLVQSLPRGDDVLGDHHDRTADHGETCPSRFRTGEGVGTSRPNHPNRGYRVRGGSPEDRGPAPPGDLQGDQRGGAGAVPITVEPYASKIDLAALSDGLARSIVDGRLEVALPGWVAMRADIRDGHEVGGVLRGWWQRLSASLRRRGVRQLAVRLGLDSTEYLEISGILGTPAEAVVEKALLEADSTDRRGRLQDAHWVRRAEYVQGEEVVISLRPPKEQETRPCVRRPGTLVVAWTHQVTRNGVREHRAIALGLTHGLEEGVRAAALHGPCRTISASPVTAQARSLAAVLMAMETKTNVSVYSNQPLVLKAVEGELQGRPGEMRTALVGLVGASSRHRRTTRKIRNGGRTHEELVVRWLAGRGWGTSTIGTSE